MVAFPEPLSAAVLKNVSRSFLKDLVTADHSQEIELVRRQLDASAAFKASGDSAREFREPVEGGIGAFLVHVICPKSAGRNQLNGRALLRPTREVVDDNAR